MPQPTEYMNAASLVSLAVLCVLGLRKLILMDGLHTLRVFVLSSFLWVAVFYLFLLALPTLPSDCVCLDDEGHTYTISE